MSTVVFVHGTGVREPDFSATSGRLQNALGPGVHVHGCYWGEHHGSRLAMDGASIPDYTPREPLPTHRSADDDEIVLWQMLGSDPLYELRLLAEKLPADRPFSLELSPGARLRGAVDALPRSDRLQALLAAHGLAGSFDAALAWLRSSNVYAVATDGAPDASAEHRFAVARALASATALEARRRGVRGGLPLAPAEREELVEAVVDALGGRTYGVLQWTWRNVLGGVAREWGTRYAVRNRQAVSDGTWPLAGDVLLYQARGDGIRGHVRECIEASGSVAVLAHSLGGIACVDLLVREALGVELLITVGSQAPLLYEIGALHGLRTGEPLPDHFPAWINIYDPRDLMAFVGGRVFPGRVEDVRVDNGAAFPESHGAYWSNPEVLHRLRALLAP